MKMTRAQKCERLQKNLCFENLFETLCCEREQTAAVWLENGRERSYDYEELHSRVMQAAARIHDAALGRPGGWVGLCMPSCPDWPVLFWGLLAAGRKPLLLDNTLSDVEIISLLTQAGADALIAGERRTGLHGYAQRVPSELTGGAYSEAFAPAWADRIALCSSGPTEAARVYVYDGRAVCRQAMAFIERQRQRCMTHEKYGRQRTLCLLPFSHIFGLMTHVIALALEGNPQVYVRESAAETVMNICRVCRVELIVATPLLLGGFLSALELEEAARSSVRHAAFRSMQRFSLLLQSLWPEGGMWLARHVLFKKVNRRLLGPALRQIVLGGAAVPYRQLRSMAALGYCVSCGYGMTETAIVAYDGAVDMEARLGGAGRLLSIAHARVTDDGELIVGCGAIHMGQMKEGRLLPPALDANGMFHTGDIVAFDRHGRLHVRGRKQEALHRAADEWIFPDEVEAAFAGIGDVIRQTVLTASINGREALVLALSLGEGMRDAVLRRRVYIEVQERNAALPQAQRIEYALCTAEALPCSGSLKICRGALRQSIEAGEFSGELLEAENGESERFFQAVKAPSCVRRVACVEEAPEYVAWQEQLRAAPAQEEEDGDGVSFAARDFAGLGRRAEVVQAAAHAAGQEGVIACTWARRRTLEREIAGWKQAATAAVVSSVDAAYMGALGGFCGAGDLVLYDMLMPGGALACCRMSEAVCRAFPHGDVYALEGMLRAQRHKFSKVLIVCQGAYEREGDVAPIAEYVRLKRQYGCLLLVDERNTDGVLGETGAGVCEHFAIDSAGVDIRLGTLMAGGGYLCGSRPLMEYLRSIMAEEPLSPMLAAAAGESIRLLKKDCDIMRRLRRNIQLFVDGAHARGLDTCLAGECAIVPVMIGNDSDALELSLALRGKGVRVSASRYPEAPRNSARLRFYISSVHSPEEIARALDLLLETADEMGIDVRKGQREA